MFTIGFLFLQTMIFLVLPLGLVVAYLLYKKQIKIGVLLKSMIVPTIMIAVAVAFLYGCSNLQRYWQLNWAINSEISASVKEKIVDFSDLYLILLCGILSAVYLLYKKPDIYVGTILLLYVNELIWRTLYFSIKLYYFKVALLYNAIVIALAFGKIYKRLVPATYVLIGLLLVYNCRFFAAENLNNKTLIETLGLIRSVSQNSAPEDKFLGISKLPLGVFNDNAHYYWFSYDYIGEIDQKKYNYAGWYDINKILKETRPEFVHFEGDLLPNYKAVSRYDINVDILHKYYKTKGYNVLYVPKDEEED
jgi:hypothetical protein